VVAKENVEKDLGFQQCPVLTCLDCLFWHLLVLFQSQGVLKLHYLANSEENAFAFNCPMYPNLFTCVRVHACVCVCVHACVHAHTGGSQVREKET
jgi:hypothetical protein